MTYCLGILNKQGIIGLADTRISSGTETTTAKKIFTVERSRHAMFIMTSGLRSVRDKAITYFEEVINLEDKSMMKLYHAVNKFGEQVKRVADEDKKHLSEAGMNFNLHAIVGGQFEEDEEPQLYLLYPQGNWIRIGPGTPFVIIGNSGFGTPVLKRSLHFDSDMEFGLKSGFLSFDATRLSANDVDYPIDIVMLEKNHFKIREKRFEENALGDISQFWNNQLRQAIDNLPVRSLIEAFPIEKNLLMHE
ncbi:MAG: peptidase [Bacteroidota bacterium]